MTNQIKNFIEEGDNELDKLLYDFANNVSDRDGIVDEIESQDFKICSKPIKDKISSRQISLIKMIVEDNIKTIESLKNNYYNEKRDKGVCESIIGLLELTNGK